MKKKIIQVLIILIGVALLVYPWIANYLNEHAAKSTISTYENEVKHTDKKEKEEMLEKAREYNEKLASSHVVLTDPFSEETNGGISEKEYYQLLNLDNTGVMCSLEIPSINVDLPVYHGTSNSVLEKGVGHLEGTSLPVGGKDTHAVFTGHTGLNKAKLFTDLTELQKGDQFYIRVLDKILAYEVCRIDVVLPEDTSKLSVVNGQDLVTLGYEFRGWSFDKYTDTISYKNGATYDNRLISATLYAQWKKTGTGFIQRPFLDSDMFYKAISILGNNGTVYNKNSVDSRMAHIDTANNPGYFSLLK